MEKDDVPKHKRVLYDQLFPVIQNLIIQIGAGEIPINFEVPINDEST
jgi:hypothetical protein